VVQLLVAIFATMESTSIVVIVPSFGPPILIVPKWVCDYILFGKGATNEGKVKVGRVWAYVTNQSLCKSSSFR
jgi:hypothetical protein